MSKRQREYLSTPRENAAFNKSYVELARANQDLLRESYIPSKNIQRFHHGSRHVVLRDEKPENVSIQSHCVEMRTTFKSLVDGDLTVLEKSIIEINNGLHAQFTTSLYKMLSETCAKTGNTVDFKKHQNISDAFEDVLSKIEFCADENENVRLPEVHVSPNNIERMQKDLDAQPQEFHQRIEEIKGRKIAEAIDKERALKARFACYGP